MGSINIVGGPTAVSAPGSMAIAMPDGSTPSVSVNGGPYQGLGGGAPVEYYASLTAGTGAQASLTLSGLNGDADGDYLIRIRAEIAVGAASAIIAVVLNGGSANLRWLCSNPLVGGAVVANWQFSQAGATPILWTAGDFIEVIAIMAARSGKKRIWRGGGPVIKNGTNAGMTFEGEFLDSATNVTSIGLTSNQAAGLGVGTFIQATRIYSTIPLV